MTSTAEAERPALERARTLMAAGRFPAAIAELDTLLAAGDASAAAGTPFAQALYLRAACQRYTGQLDGALNSIEALLAIDAQHGRAHQERGHVLLALNRPGAAEQAYRQAVALNPALHASWRALEGLAGRNGNARLQQEAQTQRTYLESLPRELLSVANMLHEGRLYKAEQLCRQYLQVHPQDVEGMRLLAALGVRNGILDDAEFILESAVEFAPSHRAARLDYVNVLYRRQKLQESLRQAELLRKTHPEDFAVETAYANQCAALGYYDRALPAYADLTRRSPGAATLQLSYGHALKTVGRVQDAIRAYRHAYQARADFGDAYWSLANLKTYRFTPDEVDAMSAQEAASTTALDDRIHLCFALGKHYEDQKGYEESFTYYERGNRFRQEQLNYSADRTSERFAQHRATFTRALFEKRAGAGCEAPDPIFIVGLPRAGSTLLEQILASHSMVDGTMELQNITAIAQKLEGRRRVDEPARYPSIVGELDPADLKALGAQYLEETRIHRHGAPLFVDKLPNNFVHIGLIQLILPNARIIDARRHPMACCFSNFKQLFASGQEYTYGLDAVGRYYRDYVELMDHWDAVLPGKVLRVQHEDVVSDLETQVRRILDHCDLPFEAACLLFHETERSIRTPSSEQVRQPIFQSGVEQWRHYEAHLDPLKRALGSVLERYPIPGEALAASEFRRAR
ncbi:MAG: sulfotransferase [Pseudomonadales bacterium]